MEESIRKELIIKRNVELECLGLSPKMYYSASSLLENEFKFTLKNDEVFFSPKKEIGKYSKQTFLEEIKKLLMDAFGTSDVIAHNIMSEWIRERVILFKMKQDQVRYWKYISIKYYEADNDEYNF